MYISVETDAPARPCDANVIREAIWDYAGSPVVTVFRGEISPYNGKPLYAHRRPRGKHVYFNGMNMLLTDPIKIGETTVFNLAGGAKRTVISEVPDAAFVNGFEVKELPNGYFDCLSCCGTVMATFSSRHDAVVWALSEDPPVLSAAARAEIDSIAKSLGIAL